MGCELSRDNMPNDQIKANENILKLKTKSVAEITEVTLTRAQYLFIDSNNKGIFQFESY